MNRHFDIFCNILQDFPYSSNKCDKTKSTVHRIMKKLDFSYITPRPKHYKQDPNDASEFKKKSTGENKSI